MKNKIIALALIATMVSANEMKNFVTCVEGVSGSQFPVSDFIDEKGKERGMFDTMDRFEILVNKTCEKETLAYKAFDATKAKKTFASVSLVMRMQNMYNAGFVAGRLKEDSAYREDKKYEGFKKELSDFLEQKKSQTSTVESLVQK